MDTPTFHIAMHPWFAMGHLTPFLHLSNKLAKKGHKISFFVPTKTQPKLVPFNLHPNLITFVPITVPPTDGLPPGAETTADVVSRATQTFLMEAMDKTENDTERLLIELKPDLVFFDFTHWMPRLAKQLGIKSVHYCIISPATMGYTMRKPLHGTEEVTEADLMVAPPDYPDSSIKLRLHEARAFYAMRSRKFGGDTLFYDRLRTSFSKCDALAFRTCREIEGAYCDYLETLFKKPVLLSGPVIPEPPTSSPLDEKWANWLGEFQANSVIYCAFGSQCILQKDQFQELLLGLEMTGMPFLAALKPPIGAESVESALPENFEGIIGNRGVVHGGWVQQQLILEHPSVGCFITHCGSGSLSEALVNKCQLVLLPNVGDQIINARMMSGSLKVGVEVEKGDEDGLFTRESVCKAVKTVMEEGDEVGKEVRSNHAKVREELLKEGLDSSYICSFNEKLRDLLLG